MTSDQRSADSGQPDGLRIDTQSVAREIADDLFRNGGGQVAERLVLELPDGREGGGWCHSAAIDRIATILQASIPQSPLRNPQSEEPDADSPAPST